MRSRSAPPVKYMVTTQASKPTRRMPHAAMPANTKGEVDGERAGAGVAFSFGSALGAGIGKTVAAGTCWPALSSEARMVLFMFGCGAGLGGFGICKRPPQAGHAFLVP